MALIWTARARFLTRAAALACSAARRGAGWRGAGARVHGPVSAVKREGTHRHRDVLRRSARVVCPSVGLPRCSHPRLLGGRSRGRPTCRRRGRAAAAVRWRARPLRLCPLQEEAARERVAAALLPGLGLRVPAQRAALQLRVAREETVNLAALFAPPTQHPDAAHKLRLSDRDLDGALRQGRLTKSANQRNRRLLLHLCNDERSQPLAFGCLLASAAGTHLAVGRATGRERTCAPPTRDCRPEGCCLHRPAWQSRQKPVIRLACPTARAAEKKWPCGHAAGGI